MNQHDCDVLILGGGLAGLCLGLQLKAAKADLRIRIVERRQHPVPEAAFKVGESTVEIAADYFSNTLGLREHLDSAHIRKFGFRFFFSEGQARLQDSTELGVSQLMPTPSWQIDRGRFENFLAERAHSQGITFSDASIVRSVELGEGDAAHHVTVEHAGERESIQARWVIDASGRASVLKRKLGLTEPNAHDVNSAWWRVQGFVDPNTSGDDSDWQQRCSPPDRWRSTNHLCGAGYWVWMIPLSSNAHSIGIVADQALHPLDTINSHEKASAWLHKHQPALATMLEKPEHTLMDFAFLRHFSHGCQQVFSSQRWALTGEAGLFLDPFYSPGSDFIAISNTYITDLILRDLEGEAFAPYASLYQQVYRSFYDNTMTLYQDQYALFGDEQVMPLKVIWDYTYYWGLLAPLAIGKHLTNISLLGRLRPHMEAAAALNDAIQPMLREWGKANAAAGLPKRDAGRPMLDQYKIDWFTDMNRALHDQLDDAAFTQRIDQNVQRLRGLAQELLRRAADAQPVLSIPTLAEGSALPAPLPSQW